MPQVAKKLYGWRPDIPDQRDYTYKALTKVAKLPAKVDLRPGLPGVYDQGQLGSCVANAVAGAIAFNLKRQKAREFMPSRLFIYYNARALINATAYDSGAYIRDGIKTVNKQGTTSEIVWPYSDAIPGPFTTRPPNQAYSEALNHQVTTYMRVTQTTNALRQCLADGFPFVFGFSVYESFESDVVAQTGIVPMPKRTERMLGGHAVVAVGYDDAKQMFLVRNSWGSEWGLGGYFWMPYAYLTNANLASDFWTLRAIEQG